MHALPAFLIIAGVPMTFSISAGHRLRHHRLRGRDGRHRPGPRGPPADVGPRAAVPRVLRRRLAVGARVLRARSGSSPDARGARRADTARMSSHAHSRRPSSATCTARGGPRPRHRVLPRRARLPARRGRAEPRASTSCSSPPATTTTTSRSTRSRPPAPRPAPRGHTGLHHVAFLFPSAVRARRGRVRRVIGLGYQVDHATAPRRQRRGLSRRPGRQRRRAALDRPREDWFDAERRPVLRNERIEHRGTSSARTPH